MKRSDRLASKNPSLAAEAYRAEQERIAAERARAEAESRSLLSRAKAALTIPQMLGNQMGFMSHAEARKVIARGGR